MAGVQSGFPEGLAKTPFVAAVDPQRCDYCGECLRAFQNTSGKIGGPSA